MEIINVSKSCRVVEPVKVRVGDVEGETRESVRDFALAAARETPESCFGTSVRFITSVNEAYVLIYRD